MKKSTLPLIIAFMISIGTLFGVPLRPPLEFYAGHISVENHPGHFPFISDMTFRAISDHVIDQTTEWFDPEDVKKGDTIYLNCWYLPWFERVVHDQIKEPYILITCDVGSWFPDPQVIHNLLYDPKLSAWFCKNILFSRHPKLFQIPMGQSIWLFVDSPKHMTYYLVKTESGPFEKQHLLYMNHYPRSFGERDKIVKLFENEPYCFSRVHTGVPYQAIRRATYYDDLALSRFTLSPLGLEIDCVRTWEAVLLDCVPIVEHTFVDDIYDGLPVVIIHDWKQVTQEFLETKGEEVRQRPIDRAYFDYWHQQILDKQVKIRKDERHFASLEATEFDSQDLQDLNKLLQTKVGKRPFSLVYRGFLSTTRPLHLAAMNQNIKQIYLYDPWLKPHTYEYMKQFLPNDFVFEHCHKIYRIPTEDDFNTFVEYGNSKVLFLDLTYFRNSLLTDFSQLRHSLKKDLYELYNRINPSTLICGNMSQDLYVSEVLEQLAQEHDISVEITGNFWIIE